LAARPASTLLRRVSRLSTVCCASVRRSFEATTAAVPVGSGTGGEGDGGDGVTDAVAAAVDVGVAVADTVGSGDDGVEAAGEGEGLLGVHPSPAAPARRANISTLLQLPGAGLMSTSQRRSRRRNADDPTLRRDLSTRRR
jgi:hypothetical protein